MGPGFLSGVTNVFQVDSVDGCLPLHCALENSQKGEFYVICIFSL